MVKTPHYKGLRLNFVGGTKISHTNNSQKEKENKTNKLSCQLRQIQKIWLSLTYKPWGHEEEEWEGDISAPIKGAPGGQEGCGLTAWCIRRRLPERGEALSG